mgnify:FL=1
MSTSHQEDPVVPYHEVFYILSLQFCTESALASADAVAACLQQIKIGKSNVDTLAILDQLQNFMNQAGAISRFFWPADKKYESRGKALRTAYSITDESPLKSRQLRNLVEHYDEYLDDFLKTASAGVFTPHYIGPTPKHDGVPRHYFKAYYFDQGIFEVLGRQFQLQPILDEVGTLHDALCSAQGGRFPRK